MDFKFTEEQEAIREAIRDLAQNEFAPKAEHYDETGEFPWENVKKLAQYGFLGMVIPEQYGGTEADTLSHTICMEEVAKACAATSVIMEVHNTLHCEPFVKFGNDEQKARYMPRLATGELLGAFALTEPNAGSDAANQSTTAVRDGDSYVLNGRKNFISNGAVADLYIVFAVTDKTKGTKGISAFLVEKGTEGLSFGLPEKKMGIRASHTTDVILENCRIPVANLLANEGDGFKIAMTTLDGGRIGIGAQALGIAQAALDASVNYAKTRVQFGKPIGQLQAVAWMLAEMATEVEAARWMVYRAAWLKDQGGRCDKEVAMAKLYASTVASKHTNKAVQIHGGYGYIQDYHVERMMRDAKITEIYEGTSEIMKLIISANLLK